MLNLVCCDEWKSHLLGLCFHHRDFSSKLLINRSWRQRVSTFFSFLFTCIHPPLRAAAPVGSQIKHEGVNKNLLVGILVQSHWANLYVGNKIWVPNILLYLMKFCLRWILCLGALWFQDVFTHGLIWKQTDCSRKCFWTFWSPSRLLYISLLQGCSAFDDQAWLLVSKCGNCTCHRVQKTGALDCVVCVQFGWRTCFSLEPDCFLVMFRMVFLLRAPEMHCVEFVYACLLKERRGDRRKHGLR